MKSERKNFWAAMVGVLVVFSLVSVKIPLTVFAFAGGAEAFHPACVWRIYRIYI